MLTMVHGNAARVENGIFHVDRKFLTGMRYYAKVLGCPLTTVHPEILPNENIMDLVQVPCSELDFNVTTVDFYDLTGKEKPKIEKLVRQSKLVYGSSRHFADISAKNRIPYIMILEHDLSTKISVASNGIDNRFRGGWRAIKGIFEHYFRDISAMRNAHSLHCNGYPAFEATKRFNENRLLYLDSRMTSNEVIQESVLEVRLAELRKRPIRLLYSGRYEKIKGASDAVRVAVECQKLGLDIEFHSYGQGSLRDDMQRLVNTAPSPDRIHIHDAIPYPELVERSREFDLFISCHIQNDPSCTYIETFGSGLPIIGYANAMFQRLSKKSKVGFATRLGDPVRVAEKVAYLMGDIDLLSVMSRRARAFCLEHVLRKSFPCA